MEFEIEAFLPDKQELFEKFGLTENGRVQRVVDTSFIHYMRLKMPQDSGTMIAKTRSPKGGLVTVQTLYAHYQNEGILYVNPERNAPGFPIYEDGVLTGYKGYRGKRVPSDKTMDYSKYGGTDRGPHFVERTINDNFNDILKEAREELNRS